MPEEDDDQAGDGGWPAPEAALAQLRANWAAQDAAAMDRLMQELAAATAPAAMLAAHARFMRATAEGFNQQISDLAALLRLRIDGDD